jgi:hypothetical protein
LGNIPPATRAGDAAAGAVVAASTFDPNEGSAAPPATAPRSFANALRLNLVDM